MQPLTSASPAGPRSQSPRGSRRAEARLGGARARVAGARPGASARGRDGDGSARGRAGGCARACAAGGGRGAEGRGGPGPLLSPALPPLPSSPSAPSLCVRGHKDPGPPSVRNRTRSPRAEGRRGAATPPRAHTHPHPALPPPGGSPAPGRLGHAPVLWATPTARPRPRLRDRYCSRGPAACWSAGRWGRPASIPGLPGATRTDVPPRARPLCPVVWCCVGSSRPPAGDEESRREVEPAGGPGLPRARGQGSVGLSRGRDGPPPGGEKEGRAMMGRPKGAQ